MEGNNGSVWDGRKALLHGCRLFGLYVVAIARKPPFNIFTNTPTIDAFYRLTVGEGNLTLPGNVAWSVF